MSDLPRGLYYPLLTLLLFGIAVLLVPRSAWRSLFTLGLIYGTAAAAAIIFILGNLLSLFSYRFVGAFHVFGEPFWILTAWLPAFVVFFYFLPSRKRNPLHFWLYLLSFSGFSMALDEILHQLGLLVYRQWGPLPRFILALVWFYLVARQKPEDWGAGWGEGA